MLTQPPFAASAMDGYGVRAHDLGNLPASLLIAGEAAAGSGYGEGSLLPGQALRIFTGAPVPKGVDTVVMQEYTARDGDRVIIEENPGQGANIRPCGGDFTKGDELLPTGKKLRPRDLALAAAMNQPRLCVRKKPHVAILATGDELVYPGEEPACDQIVSSVPYGIAAVIDNAGGVPELLGIAADTAESLANHLDKALAADILVTIGGASVGDKDIVKPVLESKGMTLDFWKVAMKPGKPLMFGKMGEQRILGLPGNPVSALVTAKVMLVPMICRYLGLDARTETTVSLPLGAELAANGPRQHYMRASVEMNADAQQVLIPAKSQDSSLLSVMSRADGLLVRVPNAPAAMPGDLVDFLWL
jgi:molybdopterin molybdotransferase